MSKTPITELKERIEKTEGKLDNWEIDQFTLGRNQLAIMQSLIELHEKMDELRSVDI